MQIVTLQQREDKELSYWGTLHQMACPNFKVVSQSSLLLVLTIGMFIVIRCITSVDTYSSFMLLTPRQMGSFILDRGSISSLKFTIFSCLFGAADYQFLLLNIIGILTIMPWCESSWVWGILVSLLVGIWGHCGQIIISQVPYQGMNSWLAGSIGLILGFSAREWMENNQAAVDSLGRNKFIIIFGMLFVIAMSPIAALLSIFYGVMIGFFWVPSARPRPAATSIPIKIGMVVAALFAVLVLGLTLRAAFELK